MNNINRDFPLLIKKLLVEVRTMSLNLLRLQEKVEAISKERKFEEGPNDKPPTPVVSVLTTPRAIKIDAETHEHKGVSQKLLERAGIIAVVAYAILTYAMWQEMKRATQKAGLSADAAKEIADLTRKQLISSEAAILQLTFVMNFSSMPGPEYGLISHIEYLSGSANVSDIHESFDVSWQRLPDLKDIGKPQHFNFDVPKLSKFRLDQGERAIPLMGLTPETFELISKGRGGRTFKIEGSWSYYDGFEGIAQQHICRIWYYHSVKRGEHGNSRLQRLLGLLVL